PLRRRAGDGAGADELLAGHPPRPRARPRLRAAGGPAPLRRHRGRPGGAAPLAGDVDAVSLRGGAHAGDLRARPTPPGDRAARLRRRARALLARRPPRARQGRGSGAPHVWPPREAESRRQSRRRGARPHPLAVDKAPTKPRTCTALISAATPPTRSTARRG